jgi:hypothetical protein
MNEYESVDGPEKKIEEAHNICYVFDENFLHDVYSIGGGVSIIAETVHEILHCKWVNVTSTNKVPARTFFREQTPYTRLLPRNPTSRTTGSGSGYTFP